MLLMGLEGEGYVQPLYWIFGVVDNSYCVIPGGRPDVMKLVREAYYAWGAEVVFITSNYQGNKEIMEGCKSEGIAAFVSNSISSTCAVH